MIDSVLRDAGACNRSPPVTIGQRLSRRIREQGSQHRSFAAVGVGSASFRFARARMSTEPAGAATELVGREPEYPQAGPRLVQATTQRHARYEVAGGEPDAAGRGDRSQSTAEPGSPRSRSGVSTSRCAEQARYRDRTASSCGEDRPALWITPAAFPHPEVSGVGESPAACGLAVENTRAVPVTLRSRPQSAVARPLPFHSDVFGFSAPRTAIQHFSTLSSARRL